MASLGNGSQRIRTADAPAGPRLFTESQSCCGGRVSSATPHDPLLGPAGKNSMFLFPVLGTSLPLARSSDGQPTAALAQRTSGRPPFAVG